MRTPGRIVLGSVVNSAPFAFSSRADRVDVVDPQADMVEPDKAVFRLLGESAPSGTLAMKWLTPAEPHIRALDAVRHHRFDDLGAEHVA